MDAERATQILAAIGLTTLSVLAFRILRFLRLHTRRSSIQQHKHPSKPSWALVTGASDGIGLAFAHSLARAGFDIIIHGRNREKLQRVQLELEGRFPTRRCKLMVANASVSEGLNERVAETAEKARRLDGVLTVLVNNVGGASNMPRVYNSFCAETTPAQIDEILNLNARFTIQLTRALVPVLFDDNDDEERVPRLVLNISSTASIIGAPYHAVYSGAKACVDRWTLALRRELAIEGRDVQIMSIVSGMVTETSWLRERTSFFVPDARRFAECALDKVGCGLPVVWGFWGHDMQEACIRWLPWWLADRIIGDAVKGYRAAETKSL